MLSIYIALKLLQGFSRHERVIDALTQWTSEFFIAKSRDTSVVVGLFLGLLLVKEFLETTHVRMMLARLYVRPRASEFVEVRCHSVVIEERN